MSSYDLGSRLENLRPGLVKRYLPLRFFRIFPPQLPLHHKRRAAAATALAPRLSQLLMRPQPAIVCGPSPLSRRPPHTHRAAFVARSLRSGCRTNTVLRPRICLCAKGNLSHACFAASIDAHHVACVGRTGPLRSSARRLPYRPICPRSGSLVTH